MTYLMVGFGVLFVLGMMFWFLTALREERQRPFGGSPNRPG
jgi:hypothetical protein